MSRPKRSTTALNSTTRIRLSLKSLVPEKPSWATFGFVKEPNTRQFLWPSGAVSFNPGVTQTFGDTVKVTGYRPNVGFPSTNPCPGFGNFQYNDGIIDNPFNNGINQIGLNQTCFDLDNNRLLAYQVFEFNPELLGAGAEFLCFDIYDLDANFEIQMVKPRIPSSLLVIPVDQR